MSLNSCTATCETNSRWTDALGAEFGFPTLLACAISPSRPTTCYLFAARESLNSPKAYNGAGVLSFQVEGYSIKRRLLVLNLVRRWIRPLVPGGRLISKNLSRP